jgi:hypothetical protein
MILFESKKGGGVERPSLCIFAEKYGVARLNVAKLQCESHRVHNIVAVRLTSVGNDFQVAVMVFT